MNDHVNKLIFKRLPGYAAFLLENCLEEYIRKQVRYSVEEEVPLLRFFSHLSEDEMVEMGLKTGADYLRIFIENRAEQYIEESTFSYRENQIPAIEREEVVARDITVVSFVRRKAFRKMLYKYTSDPEIMSEIMEEVDRFLLASESSSFQAYIEIQQERITKMLDELKESEAQSKQSQALTHIGNWSWEISTGNVTWSDEMYRIYGLVPQSEKMSFERFIALIHPDDRETRIAEIRESLQTLEAKDYFLRIVNPDGTLKVLRGRGEVVLSGGKAIKLVGTCQDITKEFELNEELKLKSSELQKANVSLSGKNAELERINKELESFNYVASHDLQEPLRKIQIFTGRILEKDEQLPEEVAGYFDKIINSTSRMRLLIDDLLKFSRTSMAENTMESTDLGQLVEEVVRNITHAGGEEMSVETGKLPVITGIPFQLQQLFLNLFSNSVKYARENVPPKIKISARLVSGNEVDPGNDPSLSLHEIRFEDNGIGFEQQDAEKIFELFQRLHGRDEYSGTGIGLAICKKIMYNHKGFITAESQPQQGAAFNIYFPA